MLAWKLPKWTPRNQMSRKASLRSCTTWLIKAESASRLPTTRSSHSSRSIRPEVSVRTVPMKPKTRLELHREFYERRCRELEMRQVAKDRDRDRDTAEQRTPAPQDERRQPPVHPRNGRKH